ncbi:MAG TPA: FAD-dependent thymidylate synthase [Vicinamibacterales bacterium]|nr:FAD-dependent thymidylate synthase [Vicinamibacterales bacterium]
MFTDDERARLAPYFTNTDRHIFALTNLPETVKGALFARYSRSAKSLRRLFLDEFSDNMPAHAPSAGGDVGVDRAEKLYARVFNEYGDDSVAQLGGAHLACEYVSNILTKVLEWGRLMAYLEQSTRYVPYTDKLDDRWRYHVPAELEGALRDRYTSTMDEIFALYAKWIPAMQEHFARRYPKSPADSDAVHRTAIRAKALDTLRGMLPAATQSNVGIYGTGQAYEALLIRMRAHPLAEVRECGDAMLVELRKVIPAFLTRVDLPDRGERWSRYFETNREAVASLAQTLLDGIEPAASEEVTLTDFDPDGEVKIVAAALYAVSPLPDNQLLAIARRMSADERAAVLRAYSGERTNRRHRPGRAFERTAYRFDVLTDYGAFRDLQRHRLLTLEWQPLTPRHGYTEPEAIRDAGAGADWDRAMHASAGLHDAIAAAGLSSAAQYAVVMAYRVRFYMDMNAREAMHLIELRTAPQGHPAYRRVCQRMHTLIAEQAGHVAVAGAMTFVDHTSVELERLGAERKAERVLRSAFPPSSSTSRTRQET